MTKAEFSLFIKNIFEFFMAKKLGFTVYFLA